MGFDSIATGVGAGCEISRTVMVDSSLICGNSFGSISSAMVISAAWQMTPMTAAVMRRRLKRGATGAVPVGMEVEALHVYRLGGGAWRASRKVVGGLKSEVQHLPRGIVLR
ncbi:MAG: hypothetical protein VB137_04885 [Burkholderia sp.]